jgi:ABC-type molybdate transport system substrate-binding protein
MQPSKALFFSIIGLAILAVIGMAVIRPILFTTTPGEIEIQIVVASSIKPWLDQAARDFNQANPKTQVKIIAANSLVPDRQFQTTNPEIGPPTAWLAEASFVVEMARSQGLQFDDVESVASTSLAWGTFNSKLDQFNQDYGSLTWQNLHAKGTNSSDVLKLVIASPQNSAAGVAALISATAGHLGSDNLSAADVSAADAWLTETFGNRNTLIPATPAGDFATKGVSAGDVGILTMASWQGAKLTQKSDFIITPTQPNVILDYPLAIWNGSQPEAKEAVQAFRAFLLESTQQNGLAEHFFDPATASQGQVQVDGTAAQRLLDGANRWLR